MASGSAHLSAGDLAKLSAGDTQQAVIGKLGAPVKPEAALPWLMYFAADHKGSYYLFVFDNKGEALRADSHLVKVFLSDLQQGHPPVPVWPGK